MMILAKPKLNKGRNCMHDDMISMHYKGWMKDGIDGEKLVFDTRATSGKPTIFNNGQHIAPKCWEIASLFMHNNDRMQIWCPSYLANGGNQVYSTVDEHFLIPEDTPLRFELELITCEQTVSEFNKLAKSQGAALIPEKKAKTDSIDWIMGSHLRHHGKTKVLKDKILRNEVDEMGNLKRTGGGALSKSLSKEKKILATVSDE